jgi:hypothetical protein
MAFSIATDLPGWATVGASKSGSAPSVYTFISASDNKAAVAASGYFNAIEDLIVTGDFILNKATDGGQLLVATNTAGVITTTAI